jgi:hypothetical protein
MTTNNNYLDIKDLTLEEINIHLINQTDELKVDFEEDKKNKDELDDKTLKEIIYNMANKYNTDHKTALIAITKFVQDGGTNTSRPNMTRRINNIDFELSDLRQIIRVYDKFGTVRKLAKSLRKVIATIAKVNNWSGPIYKDLQRINPTMIISDNDAVYCSEFNVDNYDTEMPARIREALQQREQKIREDRNKFSFQKKSKTNSGKRKRGRNRKY